jgi:hypothetical protein
MSSDINITLLRDLCPTYLTKFLIEGSNDLSTVMVRDNDCLGSYKSNTVRSRPRQPLKMYGQCHCQGVNNLI